MTFALLCLPSALLTPAGQVPLPPRQIRRAADLAMNFLDDFVSSMRGENYPPPIVESKVIRLRFATTAGDFSVDLDRALSPNGVDRFVDLARSGVFDSQILYRVVPGFLLQFGVAADPAVHAQWDTPETRLADEPNRAPFRRGTLSFAGSGPNSRTCHAFIALEPYGRQLGKADHEAALGQVCESDLHVLDRIVRNFQKTGYPDVTGLQGDLVRQGNSAAAEYPALDSILRVEEEQVL